MSDKRIFTCIKCDTKLDEDGVCRKCKERIEAAINDALDKAGAKLVTADLSPHDMLEEIVQKMVEKGHCFVPEYLLKGTLSCKFKEILNRRAIYTIERKNYKKGKRAGSWFSTYEADYGSFPDLITNPAAMKALFGEGFICTEECGLRKCRFVDEEHNCLSTIPTHIYRAMQATKIIHTEGQAEAIKYIWEEGVR
jgi:hypothetical protein